MSETDDPVQAFEAGLSRRVVRMNARLAPGEATPRRVSRSIGFVPA